MKIKIVHLIRWPTKFNQIPHLVKKKDQINISTVIVKCVNKKDV